MFPWQPMRFLMKDRNALRCHILALYVFKSTQIGSKYLRMFKHYVAINFSELFNLHNYEYELEV